MADRTVRVNHTTYDALAGYLQQSSPTIGCPRQFQWQSSARRTSNMETGLRLLMADGPVRLAFSPRLTAKQYAELLAIVKTISPGGTSVELMRAVTAAAERWGITAVCTRTRK